MVPVKKKLLEPKQGTWKAYIYRSVCGVEGPKMSACRKEVVGCKTVVTLLSVITGREKSSDFIHRK